MLFLGVTLAVVAMATSSPQLASAAPEDDDALAQVIDPDQAQGTGRVILDDGHIDFGPTLATGEWLIQIHDDTSYPRYWRMPSDVVAFVNDQAKLTVPEDEAYAFLGIAPGTEVWVIPQVRLPGVIWAGWNTQEPGVLDNLSMGTTLSILGVDGPGSVSVYLQSGNFGEPDPLWSTNDPFPQDSWIENNTHTHANWVFSDPGVYLIQVEFSGVLNDGTAVSKQDTIRFAVGDQTDPNLAFEAQFDDSQLAMESGGVDQTVEVEQSSTPQPGTPSGNGGFATPEPGRQLPPMLNPTMGVIIGIVGGLLAAAILIAVAVIIFASRNAKARDRARIRSDVAERRREQGGEATSREEDQ